MPRPSPWPELVNAPQTEAELERLRESVCRGRPFGELDWMQRAAQQLGLESSLRPLGRPRKQQPADGPDSGLFKGNEAE